MAVPRIDTAINWGALTADPASPGQGDVWYRSDHEVHWRQAASGKVRIGFQGNIPIISTTSARWYRDGYGSAAQNSSNTVANRAYAIPIWPGRKVTLSELCINIGAAFTTAGNVRAGLFDSDDDTGIPVNRITDYGTQTATAATRQWTGLTDVLYPRLYFTVITFQGGSGGTPTFSVRNIAHPLIHEVNASAVNPNTNFTAYYTDTGFSGAYPSTFGTVAGSTMGPTCAWKLV